MLSDIYDELASPKSSITTSSYDDKNKNGSVHNHSKNGSKLTKNSKRTTSNFNNISHKNSKISKNSHNVYNPNTPTEEEINGNNDYIAETLNTQIATRTSNTSNTNINTNTNNNRNQNYVHTNINHYNTTNYNIRCSKPISFKQTLSRKSKDSRKSNNSSINKSNTTENCYKSHNTSKRGNNKSNSRNNFSACSNNSNSNSNENINKSKNHSKITKNNSNISDDNRNINTNTNNNKSESNNSLNKLSKNNSREFYKKNSINNTDNDILKNRITQHYKENKVRNIQNYHITYAQNMREGFENLLLKKYSEALKFYMKNYEIAKTNINSKFKMVDMLINISICEFFRSNFKESLESTSFAEKMYSKISLGEENIPKEKKVTLGLKLYANYSLANLSMGNFDECIGDIKTCLDMIRAENNREKKIEYLKQINSCLFRVDLLTTMDESLSNIDSAYENTRNPTLNYDNFVQNKRESKITNDLFHKFLYFLKEKNYSELIKNFKEASEEYKKLNDMNMYYFCLYFQYASIYNNNKMTNKELEQFSDIIRICKNQPNGITNDDNENNDINISSLMLDFRNKCECASDMYKILYDFEVSLLSDFESNKNVGKNNGKDHDNFMLDNGRTSIYIKLIIKYGLKFLDTQKHNKENKNNQVNYDLLIKELNILLDKIKKCEIDIENIKLNFIDPGLFDSLKQLFFNLKKIYSKCFIYNRFKYYRKQIRRMRKKENADIMSKFLLKHYNSLNNWNQLIKINYTSNGINRHFYRIDFNTDTLQIKEGEKDKYATKKYTLVKDIYKIEFGLTSKNLVKKALKCEKNKEIGPLLENPWNFLSFEIGNRSIDLYCNDEQINTFFLGLQYALIENGNFHKTISNTKYILNRIKAKAIQKLHHGGEKGTLRNANQDSLSLIQRIHKEKFIANISFCKICLMFNKFIGF